VAERDRRIDAACATVPGLVVRCGAFSRTQHPRTIADEAQSVLSDPPPVDRLVVCHGDACAPNTLIGDGGRWSGHVDLGSLGVADRWADIAVATWSAELNYGPGWERTLLDAYGISPGQMLRSTCLVRNDPSA
jgi:aminoglycoside phosphotransferase